MTDKRFWLLVDTYEQMNENGEFFIAKEDYANLAERLCWHARNYDTVIADARLIFRGNLPDSMIFEINKVWVGKKKDRQFNMK